MSSDPSIPRASAGNLPLGDDPQVLRGYLLNVSEALVRQFIPQLAPSDQSRAADCITTLLRVAQSLRQAPSFAGEDASDMLRLGMMELRQAEENLAAIRQAFLAPSAGERRFERERLEKYLQAHPAGGESLRIVNAKALVNGRSKLTVLIEQQGGNRLPGEFILRQDWGAGGVRGTTVVTEFELLGILAQAGLKVPVPLLIEPTSAVLGNPFMLVTRMSGSAQGTYFDPPRIGRLALQVAEQLAHLHNLPVERFRPSLLPIEADTVQLRTQGVAAFRRVHEELGPRQSVVDLALEWLQAHCHRVQGGPSLIHNDIGCHNLLVEEGKLTAILDWELASIGNAAADLGYARHWLSQLISWDEFLRHYHAAGGPRIDPLTLDFYTLWSQVRLYTMLLQARAGIAAGVIHDLEVTAICADSVPRLLAIMSGHLLGLSSLA